MMVKRLLAGLRRRAWQRQLPKVFNLTDLDPRGVKFEATTIVERQRVVGCGEEPEYIGAMLAVLWPGDVLYDIGANVGLVALHAGHKCRTIAFEPDPAILPRLQRNLELNPDASVDVQPIAISDNDGTTTLFRDGGGKSSPSLVHQRDEKEAIEVMARTLDTMVAGGTLPGPTVLKLDIEGAEILALRGAKELLAGPAAPRALFLEVHDSLLPAFGSSADEVLRVVKEAGYTNVRYNAKRADQQHLILDRG